MDKLKRYSGIVWMLIGPAAYFFLLSSAFKNINGSAKGDISNPVPWLIILVVFLPIVIGLVIFGWYCWRGAYDKDVN